MTVGANPHDQREESEKLNDMYTMLALRDAVVKEGYMQEVEMRIVRGVLKKCLATEGNNRHMVCHDLLVRYVDLLRQPRITGFRNLRGDKPDVYDATSTADYMRRTGAMKDGPTPGL